MTQLLALPQVQLLADGVALADDNVVGLAEVRVRQELSLPTQCELTFSDPPGPLTGLGALKPGKALQVSVRGHPEPLFRGQVTAVEYIYPPGHGREVRVRGYDLLHRLRKRQSVRAHVQVTPQALAQELVDDLGLVVSGADSQPSWQHLIQHRQSDFELLTQLTEQCGLYLALRGNVLHLLTLQGMADEEPLALVLGDKLLEARIELNGEPACRSVTASGWDPLRVEAHAGTAGHARVGHDAPAEVSPDAVGGTGVRALVDELAPSDAHADGLAQALLDSRIAREVTLWAMAEGDTRLRPGSAVRVTGVAEDLTGRYVLTTVTHTIDDRMGFVSELSSVPPEPRARRGSTVATLGVVTRVDDPEGLGRVRVALPTFDRVETDWMGVVTAGAGPDKGLIMLPDVDDQVLVLLVHEEPGEGVVVGGLYGGHGPPDSGVDGGKVRRYTLQTPGGQRIQLDDVHHVLRLEDHTGSYVELGPNRLRLHAAVDLEIEAPNRGVVIRGKSIDFERA